MARCPVHRETRPRRCKTRGCPVWLSSYNPDEHCSVHGGWRRRTEDDGSKARVERGSDLADLLSL